MPKTVLIADESVTIRSVAESLLRGEGYSVRSAADGSMAVELARSERPDLILVGEKLPGITGADVCTELKSHPELKSIPLVFMRTDRPGNGPKNVDAVLLKPFSPQSLLDTARKFLNPASSGQGDGHFVSMEDPGLAEELIDQALGLDDVGAVPAEEREVKPIVTVEEEPFDSTVEPSPSAPAFGIYPGEPEERVAEPAAEPIANHAGEEAGGTLSDFQVQVGMEESSLVGDAGGERDDIDIALDEALGSRPVPQGQTPAGVMPPVAPHTSLNEISLGETGVVPVARGHVPPPAPAPMAMPSIDDEPEVERPHDYEWFIAEMAKDSKPAAQKARPEERPRIEPLITRSPQPTPPPSDFAGTTKIQMPEMKKDTSSEFDVNVEEFEASKRGYDEFISEFRKEIAKLEGTVPPSEEDHTQHSSKGAIAFKDTKGSDTERLDIARLGDQLIDAVAQQVARELAAKIDSKAIYAMIEDRLRQMGKQ
jgi:CheY-like chemotaxis protein